MRESKYFCKCCNNCFSDWIPASECCKGNERVIWDMKVGSNRCEPIYSANRING